MNIKIVIVEDEEDMLELLEYNLSREGYETIGFLNSNSVEQILEEEDIDLVIMDRNLPTVEGSEFIKQLRDDGIIVPVIFLSAKARDSEIEEGFMRGGDDYITKPFNMKELILRVKAVLRRSSKKSKDIPYIRYRDMILDVERKSLTIDDEKVDITNLEYELLYELILNKQTVLDRDYLLENVWKGGQEYQYRTVNVAINRLKDKIDPQKIKNYIQSIRGVGYKIC